MSFEEALPIFNEVLRLYQSRWTLTSYSFEDLSQDIRAHAFKKWHLYDQSRPLKPWAARLIQSQIKNALRDRYYIYQAPCLKCEMFLGDGACKLYGEVLNKCALYKKFSSQKSEASNVNFPVSYENSNYDSAQAFSCTPKEFTDGIYDALSGIHVKIFHLFYESGFSTTKIARSIQVSGTNFKQRFELVEESIENAHKLAKTIVNEKKISMGLDYE
jgi:DNA-directed RNA polymerase specialized sigma24 family protein